jgi:membrane associated rhomboid family serine protease
MGSRNRWRFFEVPHASVYLLFIANVVVFGLCLSRSGGSAVISADVLFRAGAMYSLAIERHEYWRLLAYGFLHADPIHLATNMFCLVLWGAHLERRVGSAYFLAIYACALVTGGTVATSHMSDPILPLEPLARSPELWVLCCVCGSSAKQICQQISSSSILD